MIEIRFITEEELRVHYMSTPFDQYRCPEDARITPAAKQFLIDHRIAIETGITTKKTAEKSRSETNIVVKLALNKLKELELHLLLYVEECQVCGTGFLEELKKMSTMLSSIVDQYFQPKSQESAIDREIINQVMYLRAERKLADANINNKMITFKWQLLMCKFQQVQLEIKMILPRAQGEEAWYLQVMQILDECIRRLSLLNSEINGDE